MPSAKIYSIMRCPLELLPNCARRRVPDQCSSERLHIAERLTLETCYQNRGSHDQYGGGKGGGGEEAPPPIVPVTRLIKTKLQLC